MNFANKSIVVLCVVTFSVLLVFLLNALIFGNFSESGPILFTSPWGLMSLADLYAGFFLFAAFILKTEKNKLIATLWILSLMALGNLIACIYLLIWAGKQKGTENGTLD